MRITMNIPQQAKNNTRAPRIFTTQSGVNLRIRPVPGLAVLAAQRQLVEPQVPKWYNDAKQREEENPLDPAYVKAVEDYKIMQGEIVTDTYLANGVQVFGALPDDVFPVDSEEWSEGLKLVGINIPDNGAARRLAWLRFHVLGDGDLADLLTQIALAGGSVTQEAVEAAAESFRDNKDGATDTGVPSIE